MSTLTNDEDEAVQLLNQPGPEQEVDSDFEREFTQLVGTRPGQSAGPSTAAGQPGQASAQETSAQEENNGTVDFKVMLRKGAKPRSVQVQPCTARKSHRAANLGRFLLHPSCCWASVCQARRDALICSSHCIVGMQSGRTAEPSGYVIQTVLSIMAPTLVKHNRCTAQDCHRAGACDSGNGGAAAQRGQA